MTSPKFTENAWEERTLGAEEDYVVRADQSHEDALDEALELQSISIRLPKQMIRQYKFIAAHHAVGYQPLMRDVLARFVPAALSEVFEAEQERAVAAAAQATIPEPMKKAA